MRNGLSSLITLHALRITGCLIMDCYEYNLYQSLFPEYREIYIEYTFYSD